MLAGIQDPEILRYYSHYGVNAAQLRSDFASYAAKPPLAFNAKLMASARAHARGPNMIVSDAERRLGSRYTIDVLRLFKARYPGVKFVTDVLIG